MSEYYVRSHTFCCCIPVRLGVFITSILGIGLGGLLTVAGIIQLKNLGHAPLSEKWPYIIQIVVYGLYAVVSITAFIGATCRKLQLIRSYAVVLAVHLIFSIASGGYSLFHYFKDSPNVVAECINGSTDATKIQVCKQGEDVVKGVMVGVFYFRMVHGTLGYLHCEGIWLSVGGRGRLEGQRWTMVNSFCCRIVLFPNGVEISSYSGMKNWEQLNVIRR